MNHPLINRLLIDYALPIIPINRLWKSSDYTTLVASHIFGIFIIHKYFPHTKIKPCLDWCIFITTQGFAERNITKLLWFHQSASASVTLWPCEHQRSYAVLCLPKKLGTCVNNSKMINPIDFVGRWSQWENTKITLWTWLRSNHQVNMVNSDQTWHTCCSWWTPNPHRLQTWYTDKHHCTDNPIA